MILVGYLANQLFAYIVTVHTNTLVTHVCTPSPFIDKGIADYGHTLEFLISTSKHIDSMGCKIHETIPSDAPRFEQILFLAISGVSACVVSLLRRREFRVW
jgi:hypothetical protein